MLKKKRPAKRKGQEPDPAAPMPVPDTLNSTAVVELARCHPIELLSSLLLDTWGAASCVIERAASGDANKVFVLFSALPLQAGGIHNYLWYLTPAGKPEEREHELQRAISEAMDAFVRGLMWKSRTTEPNEALPADIRHGLDRLRIESDWVRCCSITRMDTVLSQRRDQARTLAMLLLDELITAQVVFGSAHFYSMVNGWNYPIWIVLMKGLGWDYVAAVVHQNVPCARTFVHILNLLVPIYEILSGDAKLLADDATRQQKAAGVARELLEQCEIDSALRQACPEPAWADRMQTFLTSVAEAPSNATPAPDATEARPVSAEPIVTPEEDLLSKIPQLAPINPEGGRTRWRTHFDQAIAEEIKSQSLKNRRHSTKSIRVEDRSSGVDYKGWQWRRDPSTTQKHWYFADEPDEDREERRNLVRSIARMPRTTRTST